MTPGELRKLTGCNIMNQQGLKPRVSRSGDRACERPGDRTERARECDHLILHHRLLVVLQLEAAEPRLQRIERAPAHLRDKT